MSASRTHIDPDTFYTLGQAAKLTGFSRDVLAARCDSGVLSCRRAAGIKRAHRRVKGADLLLFMAASRAKVEVPAPPVSASKTPAVRDKRKAELYAALKEMGCA